MTPPPMGGSPAPGSASAVAGNSTATQGGLAPMLTPASRPGSLALCGGRAAPGPPRGAGWGLRAPAPRDLVSAPCASDAGVPCTASGLLCARKAPCGVSSVGAPCSPLPVSGRLQDASSSWPADSLRPAGPPWGTRWGPALAPGPGPGCHLPDPLPPDRPVCGSCCSLKARLQSPS